MLRELQRFETSPQCTTATMLASITDSVRRLFKISALIAKATTRDRHTTAMAKVDCSMYRPYYAAHVRAKMSGRNPPEWMVSRMTEATLKRRQFVQYTDGHYQRLKDEKEELAPAAVEKSVAAQTKASTVGEIDLNAADDGFDDLHSITTAATTVDGGDGFSGLKVPALAIYTVPGEHFLCPVCHTTKCFNGQLAWK